MSITLKALANRAKDLYFQDYAPRDAFFDVNDFMFHAATIYSSMLNMLFQQNRKMSKAEDFFNNVENSSAWLISEPLEIKTDEATGDITAKTKQTIYNYDFDGNSQTLQDILSKKGVKYRKLSLNERKFQHTLPITSVIYYSLGPNNTIEFSGMPCNGDKPVIQYVPVVVGNDGNCVMSDNIAADVIKQTLTLMFGAKSGMVVDETNDGNRNTTLQNQSNPQINKAQQQ